MTIESEDFTVFWWPADESWVGTCVRYPSLSYLAAEPDDAMRGIKALVEETRNEIERACELEIDVVGGNCPVQAEGTIGGWPFYFRARGRIWELQVAEPGFCPVEDEIWEHLERYSNEPYAAGWMGIDEARLLIAKAAWIFKAWRTDNPKVDGSGRATALMLRQRLRDERGEYIDLRQHQLRIERRVVRLCQALGLNPSEYVIAQIQVKNGVEG